jgi:hypothetical protein
MLNVALNVGIGAFAVVGTDGYCSPPRITDVFRLASVRQRAHLDHRMPFKKQKTRVQNPLDDVAGNICQAIRHGRARQVVQEVNDTTPHVPVGA